MTAPPDQDEHPHVTRRIDAAGLADAAQSIAPASILLAGPTRQDQGRFWGDAVVLAVGTPAEVDAHPQAAGADRVSRPRAVLIPALANAHTHLDLTHIGPVPHDPAAGFVSWVNRLRAARRTDAAGIADAVAQGAALARRAGVMAVGDIAGALNAQASLFATRALAATQLAGTSHLEAFALGVRTEQALLALEAALEAANAEVLDQPGPAIGISPHAPYSVSIPSYLRMLDLAAERNLRVHTHLAETPEERQFISAGTGPNRDMLESFGIWSDDELAHLGRTTDPVLHLEPVLRRAAQLGVPMVCAHVNDCSDAAIELLAETRAHVVYCPRASAYFAAESHFGPHRYRDMLAAGVRVALGTDSILNLPADTPARGMSTLDEARVLFERTASSSRDAHALLAMATSSAAEAIGLDPSVFSLAQGAAPAGVLAVDVAGDVRSEASRVEANPAAAVLGASAIPEVLFARQPADLPQPI